MSCGGPGPAVAWSCLIDETPEIRASVLPWIASLIGCAGIDPSRIRLHHVCSLPIEVAALARDLGIATIRADPFDTRHPHTNKIRQCATDFGDADTVVLCDVDVAFTAPPPFERIGAAVAGKPVDRPNPPLEVLERVFAAAGLTPPAAISAGYTGKNGAHVPFETLPGNYNGGIYVLAHDAVAPVGQAWERWAAWLAEDQRLPARWSVHIDQVAFCLAVNDLGIDLQTLGPEWNFPLHLDLPRTGAEPFILHHHALIDGNGNLDAAGAPWLDPAIARVNEATAALRQERLAGRPTPPAPPRGR